LAMLPPRLLEFSFQIGNLGLQALDVYESRWQIKDGVRVKSTLHGNQMIAHAS
jgi:hypothetical protein